jgi:hypothetical protein
MRSTVAGRAAVSRAAHLHEGIEGGAASEHAAVAT